MSTSRRRRRQPAGAGEVKVFVAWSGKRSRKVAERLTAWLPQVVRGLDIYLSTKDIAAGQQWVLELRRLIRTARFGILCVTEKNARKPWVLFEAGALWGAGRPVVPYRIGVKGKSLPGPLTQLQTVAANRSGTQKLIEALSKATATGGSPARLKATFEQRWPDLKRKLDKIQA